MGFGKLSDVYQRIREGSRIFGKFSQFFALSLSSFFFFPQNLHPFDYEYLLQRAQEKIETDTPARAFPYLQKAREIQPEVDYRFHNLMGDAHWKMHDRFSAMESYERSLESNEYQFPLFIRIADFYEEERKPDKALVFSEKYLALVPNDKNRIFRAAILSRRMGRESNYDNYIKILESDITFESEKESLRSTLNRYLKNKKWKEAESLALKYLPYFPREEWMYESLILARRHRSLASLEDAYMMACVIFKEETKYFVRYGVLLQEKKRYFEALSSLRKAFRNSVKFQKNQDWDEILFLLRQTYSNLGREKDSYAIDSLVNDTRIRNDLNPDTLKIHIQTFRKNREYLIFGMYWFLEKEPKASQEYKQLIRQRDEEFENTELLFVLGPFAKDANDLE